MAKLGDLIVKIGADTRDLNKQLGRVRRNMRSMTSNFKSLGQDLTRSLTLPLAAIGAASIKSAADLEKLETSFISLTGGAEQAAAMMSQLNDFTAKTPFQIEAVANSARQLIASGTDVSKVNEQLQFLGDIAATSGVEINEIAAIFAKVNAKGKVELENLNQLAERGIPIFKALSDATGLPADKLGAGAVSVEQFNKTLKSFAEEGGFAAGAMERLSETAAGKFSTALDNLKIAGAELVESLMPALKDAIDFVTKLAQKFTALDDNTKKIILIVGGLVAAIGPLILGLSSVFTAVQTLTTSLTVMAGPVGLVVAGVTAAVAVFMAYKAATKEVETANDRLKDSISAIETNTKKQTYEARRLVDQYGKEKTSLEDRERILKRLKEIDSKHFGNLKAESTQLSELNTQLESYINNVRAAAIEKQLQAEASAVYNKVAEAEIALFDAEQALAERQIQLQKQHAEGIATTNVQMSEGFQIRQRLSEAQAELIESTSELQEFEQRRTEILSRYNDTLNDVTTTVEENNDTVDEATEKVINYSGALATLPPVLIAVDHGTKELQKSTSTVADLITDDMRKAAQAFEDFATSVDSAIERSVETMISGVSEMIGTAAGMQKPLEGVGAFILDTFANLAIELGNLAIGYGVAIESIKLALESLSGPVAIAAGVALVALGAGLKGAIKKRAEEAGMPALANGGLAYGPTTAIVGDNKNARIDPEVIAPLSKLQDIMGGNSIQVFGRISGDDILLSNTRAARDRNRYA